MSRFPRGLTLAVSERMRLGMTASSGGNNAGRTVHSHTLAVTLPDDTTCQVNYSRFNRLSHRLTYAAPIQQHVWVHDELPPGVESVERLAQEHAVSAFCKAQEAERDRMRRKSLSRSEKLSLAAEGLSANRLSTKEAAEAAGNYALCVRHASGDLQRIGPIRTQPADVLTDGRSGLIDPANLAAGQILVIGIGNRARRCWQEPAFLAARLPPDQPSTKPSRPPRLRGKPACSADTDESTAIGANAARPSAGTKRSRTTPSSSPAKLHKGKERAEPPSTAPPSATPGGTNPSPVTAALGEPETGGQTPELPSAA